MDRIVLLIDMDCFYVQVEQRDRPETRGKPCAVAQYNGATGGGIIAVSYEARGQGIKRGMWGKTALKTCADLILFEVPEKRGKADLAKYRAAGAEVIQCISEFLRNVERASIDEAYVDLTDFVTEQLQRGTHSTLIESTPTQEAFVVVNPEMRMTFAARSPTAASNTTPDSSLNESLNRPDWMDLLRHTFADGERYALASALTYHIRQTILRRTGFTCSAGIAPNKTLAKLACSLNKPNKQTLVPPETAPLLIRATPVTKIRNLGGKLGTAIVNRYGIENLGQLTEISLADLTVEFGEKTAQWLYNLCRGHDTEPVTARQIPQSIGCSKNFPGRSALATTETIRHWLLNLAGELVERLEADRREHRRRATRLTLHVRTDTVSANGSFSRVLPANLLASIGVVGNKNTVELPSATTGTPTPNAKPDEQIAQAALRLLQEQLHSGENSDTWKTPITLLALTVGKFSCDFAMESGDLRAMLAQQSASTSVPIKTSDKTCTDLSYSSDASTSPVISKRKSSPIHPDDKPTSAATVPTSATTSFFKRLRVAELSASGCPPTTTVSHPPLRKLNPITEPTRTNPDPPVESGSNSRSSDTSDAPAVFFTSYSVGDWIVCDECGSRIAVWQAPEHSDFHVAQRIQHEWTREENYGLKTGQQAATTSSSSYGASSLARPKEPSNLPSRLATHKRRIGKKNQKVPATVTTLDRFIRSSRSS